MTGGLVEHQNRPVGAERTIRYQERWGYKFPGVLWWVALLVVPILFAAFVSSYNRADLETDLTTRSLTALDEAGLDEIHVVFFARDATLDVPFGEDVTQEELDMAVKVVAGVEGVRSVQAREGSVQGSPAPSDDQEAAA